VRYSAAQAEWAKLTAEQRVLARQAARGYVAQCRAKKTPPHWRGAHLFLRERAAWPKFAEIAPDAAKPSATSFPSDSPEAAAIRALYAVAHCTPFEHKNRLIYAAEITPQLMAFAKADSRSEWPWFEASKHIAAWSDFLAKHVLRDARPPLVVTRGIGDNQRRGINAPWPYPPRMDGTVHSTGPPETDLMDEDDHANFHG
jgi:hypothetical protein